MATIDPNIALGYKPIQIENPMNQYAMLSQLQGNQQAQQLNALKMRQAQQEFDTSNALANAYKGAITPEGNVNYNALIPQLASSGAGSAIPGVLKTKKETEQAAAMLEKTQTETKAEKLKLIREKTADLINNPSPENIKAHAQDGLIQGAWSPEQADAFVQQALSIPINQRPAFFKEQSLNAEKRVTTAETARHNLKTENIQQQNANINADQLTVAQQRLANESNVDLQSKIAEAKSVGTTIGKNKAAAAAALPSAIATATQTINLIDDMVGKPEIKDKNGKVIQQATKPRAGFNEYVGFTLLPGQRFIEGSDAASFELRQKQIEGKAFLEAFETLRGGGSITEKEGEKGAAAIMRMNKASSKEEYITAARELQDVLRSGIAIKSAKAGVPVNNNSNSVSPTTSNKSSGIAPPAGFTVDKP